jgi:replicative DNA helicase
MTTPMNPQETEMRLLGGALVSIDWANDLTNSITAQYFLSKENREIFSTINYLVESDQVVDLDKIVDLSSSKGVSAEHCVNVMMLGSSRSIPFQDLVDQVRDSYFKRRMAEIGANMASTAQTSPKSEADYLKDLEEELYSVHGSLSKRKTSRVIHEILNKPVEFMTVVQEMQNKHRSGQEIFEGIPTGYADLDRMINSLKPGHLTLVGARPSVEHLSVKLKLPGLFFSLEMPAEELAEKLLLQVAEVPTKKFEKGDVTGDEYQRIVVSNASLKSLKLIIEDQPSLSIDQIKARALRAAKAHDIKYIVIDYVQLITCKAKAENRHVEVGQISRVLKEIAKTLNIPIIGLAQLNRESDKRESKVPMMSDLRESGALEADADEILLLHRPDQYDPHDKPGLMQIIVAKNRFGETGKFSLNFQKEIGKLSNYANYERDQ